MADILAQVDAFLDDFFSGHNIWTAVIGAGVIAVVTASFFLFKEPDLHPMLIAHAASPDQVRQPGESAVYRAHEVAGGFPLRTGLGVKYPSDPTYSTGRNGTITDIWNVFSGVLSLDSKSSPAQAKKATPKLMTVFGKEITDHALSEVTQEINVIGQHIKRSSHAKVAVYLPNSLEFLSTVIAGASHAFDVILIPYNQPHDTILEVLHRTGAEVLVAAAGSLPLSDVARTIDSMKEAIWVVERTSRHMDWKEVPSEVGGRVEVSVWHELIEDHASETESKLPDTENSPGDIVTIWQDKAGSPFEIVQFKSKNVMAAVAATVHHLPRSQRLSQTDLFLPAEALTQTFALVQTLAALFQRSNVALNSVAGAGVSIAASSVGISPTVIVTSAESAARLHTTYSESMNNIFSKIWHLLASRTLAGGTMPSAVTPLLLGSPEPGKLRLLLIADRAACPSSPALPGKVLSDLRAATGARVIYALTAAKVAGAVAQTGVFDYRVDDENDLTWGHFGSPMSCLEIKVVDTDAVKTTDQRPQGEIVVSGPSVADGSANLHILGWFRRDHCLARL